MHLSPGSACFSHILDIRRETTEVENEEGKKKTTKYCIHGGIKAKNPGQQQQVMKPNLTDQMLTTK